MPLGIDEAQRILQLVASTALSEKYQWLIKFHPTVTKKYFEKMVPEMLHNELQCTTQPLTDLFQNTRLVFTSASSISLEAVVCGIPVAILGNRSGPSKNPLHGIVDQNYWSICYTPSDLRKAIFRTPPEKPLNNTNYLQNITPRKG